MKNLLAILALCWLGSISLHASGLTVYETDGPHYVQFGVLNNGANPGNPAPVGTSYKFGETTDFSGWIETTLAEYGEVEDACEGDCVSVKFSKLPSYKASCKVYVVSATVDVAYKDEYNQTKTLSYNAVSQSEVVTHEYGHADIAALGNAKGSGIWEGEVAGYQSSCQTDQSTCESECGDYLTAARTGAYITSGVRE